MHLPRGRPRCSASLIPASPQPQRSSLSVQFDEEAFYYTHSNTRDFRPFMSTQSHLVHDSLKSWMCSFLIDFFRVSLLRWSCSILMLGSIPFSVSRLDVYLFWTRLPPSPPTFNTREASPPERVSTPLSPLSRRPPTQPSRQIDKGTLSKRVSLPKSKGGIPVCDACCCWQRKVHQCPSLPQIFSFALPSCL